MPARNNYFSNCRKLRKKKKGGGIIKKLNLTYYLREYYIFIIYKLLNLKYKHYFGIRKKN